MMNLLILGAQGSGKGTQAKKIAQKFGLFYLSTGDILREVAKERRDINELINKKGALVPDETTFEIMTDYLANNGVNDKIIFDGYPRSIKQFNLLKSWLADKGKKIDLAILLEIGDEEAIKRLSARRMDPATGKIYNLETEPKPGPEVVLSTLVQRGDDKPEAIKQRLALYKKRTQPLIEVLQKEGILIKVEGERPIETIFQEIVGKIKS